MFVELRRVDPKNRLLDDNEQLQAIYKAGVKEYVRLGRKSRSHAKVVTLGIFKVQTERKKISCEEAFQKAMNFRNQNA